MNKIIKSFFYLFCLLLLSGCQEKKWTVVFDVAGGSPIASLEVPNQTTINLELPSKEGYRFLGWFDANETKYEGEIQVNKDLNLQAKWKKITFSVRFEYEDGTLIEEQTIDYGNDAIAPTPKNVLGYRFVGWSSSFSNVVSNLKVVAQYEILSFEVIYLDFDNTILKQETVAYGQNGTAPTEPTRTGYNFIAWDQEFTQVTRNLTVRALYEEEAFGLVYVLDDEVYYVHGYTGTNNEIVIPTTYNNFPVVGIYEKAFLNNDTLSKVTISEGIIEIGAQAFSGCVELTTVILPNTLESIGEEAFNACSRLAAITIGAPTIGVAAFSGCTGLKTIALLNTVESIGGWGFWGNSSLKTLYIPESVVFIGKHAFSWCTNLLTIYTPEANVEHLKTLLAEAENIYVKYTVKARE
ncbi:MAG TPA: leucine-rich repeat protein [Bacilli bacterium]|nr:leucine-rich repeat protein [Bacilli bacterium]